MKYFLSLGFFILILSSCKTSIYTIKKNSNHEGLSYSLPKNLIKVEILYTLNEPRRIDNGLDKDIPGEKVRITIEDPIVISTVLTADNKETYQFNSDENSNNFFLDSDLDIKLSNLGLLSSIDLDTADNSIEFVENILVSTAKLGKVLLDPGSHKGNPFDDSALPYSTEAYKLIVKTQKDMADFKKKEDVELALKKVNFYKEQIQWYLKNFKVYYKKSKIRYSVTIDPTNKYLGRDLFSEIKNKKLYHHIYPDHIFPEDSNLKDTITIVLPKLDQPKFDLFKDSNFVKGVICRTPGSVSIDIESNNRLLSTSSINLIQFGNTSVIPVDSKKGGKKKTSLAFSSITGGIIGQKVVAGSSSEKFSKSLKNTVDEASSSYNYVKYESKIKELQTQKSIKDLRDSLKDPEEEVDEPETDFEKELREFKEKEQLLQLEFLIKELQQKILELEEID